MTCRPLVFALVFAFASTAAAASKRLDHPAFLFYKMKTGGGLVSLAVPPASTDAQLEALLGFIREKVQRGEFAELGILHPVDKRFGKLGYDAGIILVFRGKKCANEPFIETLGPCGYGEHDAASYQWGIAGDSRSDEGLIRSKDGAMRKVF